MIDAMSMEFDPKGMKSEQGGERCSHGSVRFG